ncbi:MAG: hypothetical protein NT175_04310 [Bacteroidetes bacterium]|nr:hypothetical protein [Bacteroidota bacterium]
MKDSLRDQFLGLTNTFIEYMPNLLGGILLVIIGWILGWIVKRLLIQLAIILKLERLFMRYRWGSDFVKADIRYTFNNLIGNFGFLIIFLIFVDNAIIVWKLTILADLLSKGILFLPKILIALFVFGIGWFIASWAARSVLKTLHREAIPRSSLISRFVKSVLIVFFAAMALVVLDVAKEIVIIGFATIIITLGCITIIIVTIGGKKFIKNFEKFLDEEKSDNV